MKRIIITFSAFILIVFMLCLALTACEIVNGGGNGGDTSDCEHRDADDDSL